MNAIRTTVARLAGIAALALPTVADAQVNTNQWYRLTTMFLGDDVALDVINDGNNNRVHMVKAGNYSGQYWRFTEAPGTGGGYRLSCMWQGVDKTMDIFNGGPDNNQPHLTDIGPYSGQIWYATPVYGSYFKLTTMFRGPDMALEAAGGPSQNRPFLTGLDPNGNPYSGQAWKLTPLGPIDNASIHRFGHGCQGADGEPGLHFTDGSGPWIGETMTGINTNIPLGAFARLIVGVRSESPTDLGFLGSPQCALFSSMIVRLPLNPSGGTATWSIPIPNDRALIGKKLSLQGLVVDPYRLPFVATSAPVELVFGAR